MTDPTPLVERLRWHARNDYFSPPARADLTEAADEIERLRKIAAFFVDRVMYPEDLDPDSSTVTAMFGFSGKQLRRAVGWTDQEQRSCLDELMEAPDA